MLPLISCHMLQNPPLMHLLYFIFSQFHQKNFPKLQWHQRCLRYVSSGILFCCWIKEKRPISSTIIFSLFRDVAFIWLIAGTTRNSIFTKRREETDSRWFSSHHRFEKGCKKIISWRLGCKKVVSWPCYWISRDRTIGSGLDLLSFSKLKAIIN